MRVIIAEICYKITTQRNKFVMFRLKICRTRDRLQIVSNHTAFINYNKCEFSSILTAKLLNYINEADSLMQCTDILILWLGLLAQLRKQYFAVAKKNIFK